MNDQAKVELPEYQFFRKVRREVTSEISNEKSHVTVDFIARVCHEVNKAYCESLGDLSQPSWGDAPDWQKDSARLGVRLHFSADYGPEISHASWMKQKIDEGWVYGEVKDPGQKTHPCIVPFNDLPKEQQAKDFIFRQIVHSLKRYV